MPVFLEPTMVLLQALDMLHEFGVAAGQQRWEDDALLLRMVMARGAVEECPRALL